MHIFNPYTKHILYMPGYVKGQIHTNHANDDARNNKNKTLIRKIIEERNELFIVSVKGHCSDLSKVINFPPIIRNVEYTTSKDIIGEPMYNYMKKHGMPVDKKERKLTQMTDTHNEYMTFSSYYLWFLMDTCGFVIDDVKDMYVFTKHRGYKGFVEEFMKKRQKASIEGDGVGDTFYKICLNGSYGYDILNNAGFAHTKFCNTEQTFSAQLSSSFVSTRKLGEDKYQVQYTPRTYECNTAIVQGFFTLDNAKFWYLNFIYNFMYKCLDMTKIHFVEGDTDSMYFAVAGNPDEGNEQGFKYVIKDEKFYNKHIYKFLPASFYSTDNSNPKFNDKLQEKLFNKKLGGLEIEKHCDGIIALAPKMYTCFNLKNETLSAIALHVKGVSKHVQKREIKPDNFVEVIENKTVKEGSMNNLQLVKGIMSKIELRKNFITAAHTKYRVSEDFTTCLPLFNLI
jgi:hypothetical protein